MRGKKCKNLVRVISILLAVLLVGQVPAERIAHASNVQTEAEDTKDAGTTVKTEETEVPEDSAPLSPEETDIPPVAEPDQSVAEVPQPQEAAEPETTEALSPVQRQPKDWTNELEELKLNLERIIYYQADDIEPAKTNRETIVQTDGVIDIQAVDLDGVKSMDAELGFSFQRERAGRLVLGEDTFQFSMPEEYFQMADNAVPVAVMNRAAADIDKETSVQLASYTVKDNVVTVTFTDAVNADNTSLDEASQELIGRITFPVTVKKEALSADENALVKITLQEGTENTVVLPKNAVKSENPEITDDKAASDDKVTASVKPTESENNQEPAGHTEVTDETEKSGKSEAGFLNKLKRKAISILSELGLRVGEEQRTISKTINKPQDGVSKVTIKIASHKDGYDKNSTDLGIDFGIDIILDDAFLYQKLSQFENAPDFPKFNSDLDAFNNAVDNYLKALSDEKLPPIIYKYDLGKDITVPDGKPVAVQLKDEDGNAIASLTVVKQEDGHCVASVEFVKQIYNRDGVAAGESVKLAIDKNALQDDEKVNVGWKDDQLVVATEGYLNEDKPGEPPKIEYKVEKTALDKVDTPYIDYEIAAEAFEGKTLNGYYLEDKLPQSKDGSMKLEVISMKVLGSDGKYAEVSRGKDDTDPAAGTYTIKNSTLLYRFPDVTTPPLTSSKFQIRLALDQASYEAYVKNPSGVDVNFSNRAVIKESASDSKNLAVSETADTEMKMQFMSKEGKPEGLNGLRYSWTLGINTKFTKNVSAYVVDTICWSDHQYDAGAGILVYEDGKYKSTLHNVDRITGSTPYEQLTKENITGIANGRNNPFYYVYPGTDGKEYAVLIIPFGSDYQNKNIKFKYYTEMNLEGMTPSDWLAAGKPAKILTNNAKLIWTRYTYGEGIGLDDFDAQIDINKDVNTDVALGSKEAGDYDESTQTMQWKFKLNGYGAHLTNARIEDVLNANTYDWDTLNLMLYAYDRNNGDVGGEQIPAKPGSSDAKGMSYERDGDKLIIHAGELKENDYYEIILEIKVKDESLLTKQGEAVGTLSNAADIFAGVNGKELEENTKPVNKDIPNTLIKKESVGDYDYKTKQLKWKTTVDMNHIPISGAVIDDALPTGSSFKVLTKVTRLSGTGEKEEAVINGTAASDNIAATFTDAKIQLDITAGMDGTYNKQDVKFTVSDSMGAALIDDNTSYIFEYTTEVTDMNWLKAQFQSASKVDIINVAKLTGTIGNTFIDAAAAADAKVTVTNDMIKKNGKYYPTDGFIRWNITFNQACVDISGMKLVEDIGVQPLEIDTDTIALYEVGDNGAEKLLKSVKNDGQSWLQTSLPKKVEYVIPVEYAEKTMKLTFDTYITEDQAAGSEIQNTAKLMNGADEYQGSDTSDGGYTGGFNMDNYVKAAKKPVLQIIKISKNDDPHSKKPPLSGAEFALTAYGPDGAGGYSEASDYNKAAVTDTKGKITFVNLKKEYIYKLEETDAPAGYDELNAPARYYLFRDGATSGDTTQLTVAGQARVVILMSGDEGIVATDETTFDKDYLIFENTPKNNMNLQFQKKSPGGTESIDGCVFDLIDVNGRLKTQRVTSGAAGVTGEVAFTKIDPGKYELIEWTSIDPYDQGAVFNVEMFADGIYTISHKSGNASVSSDGSIIENEYAKGKIKLKKVDDKTGNIPLEGAEFTLRDKADVLAAKTAVSGKDGTVTFTDVPYNENEYSVEETKPAPGYRNDSNFSQDITVNMLDDALTANSNKDGKAKTFEIDLQAAYGGNVKNTRTKGSISFTKLDDPLDTGKLAGEKLAGRTFKLYYTDSDGYNGYDKTGKELIATETTTADSPNLVFNNIPYGNYKLVEVMSDIDIYKSYEHSFTLRGVMQDSLDENRLASVNENEFSVEVSAPITNSLLKGSFTLNKKDESTGETMQNVEFTLDGTNASGGTVHKTLKTDTAGKVTFSDIPIGAGNGETAYTLTETKADGYEVLAVYSVYVKAKDNKAVITLKASDGTILDKSGTSYLLSNKPVKGTISLKKQDSAGTGLPDAEFTLYRVVNGEKVTADTDPKLAPKMGTTQADGLLTFSDVEYGNYILEETKAPVGYMLPAKGLNITKADLVLTEPDKDTFTCEQWTDAADGTITNTPTKIKLVKQDQFGKNVNGAVLELSGEFADGSDSHEWTTGAGAEPEFVKLLIVGKSYILKEKTAPVNGLYKTIKNITFDVKSDGTLEKITGQDGEYKYENGVLTAIDKLYLAPVELTKTGETSSGGQEALEGVEFNLYQQTGSSPDLTTDIKINTNPITTDALGKWDSRTSDANKDEINPVTKGKIGAGLSKGTYYFVETSTKDNYILDEVPQVFTIGNDSFDADGSAISAKSVKMENELVNAAVKLVKIDSKDGSKIPGTTFCLTKPDGTTVFQDTDKNGEITFANLGKGNYTLTETKANDNYLTDNLFTGTFTVTDKCKDKTLDVAENSKEAVVFGFQQTGGSWSAKGITNIHKTGSVSLTKQGQTGADTKPLEGAVFGLYYAADDTAVQKDGTDITAVTDSNGILKIESLDWAKYYLKELKAPEGFALDESRLEFEIGYGKLDKAFSTVGGSEDVVNKATKLTIAKLDEDTNQGIIGAVFTLAGRFKGEEAATVREYDMTSDSSRTIFGELLADENYTLTEIKAPSGYTLASPISFKVTKTGDIMVDGKPVENQTISVVDKKTRIDFKKYGKLMESCADELLKDYSEELAGAEFTIYTDKECTDKVEVKDAIKANPVTSSAKESVKGLVEFLGLPGGAVYYFKETKAPKGYQPNENVYAAKLDEKGVYKGISIVSGPALQDKQSSEAVKEGKIINDLYRTDISLKKVSEQDNSMALPDSTYGLYKRTSDLPEGLPNTAKKGAQMAGVYLDLAAVNGVQDKEEWTLIAKAKTDINGMLTFKGILANTQYRVQELIAPDGSQVSAKPIEITFKTVEKDGKLTVVVDKFDNGDGTARVDPDGNITWLEPSIMLGFTKQDMDGNNLTGARLELQDMNGKVLEAWTSTDTQYVIHGDKMNGAILAGQQYQLVEKEAPAGYAIAEPVVFIVEEKLVGPGEEFIQSIIMKDEKLPESNKSDNNPGNNKNTGSSAKTGDYAPVMLYLTGLVLAVSAALGAVRRKRKNRS